MVLPANLANVFAALEYSVSPSVYVVIFVPALATGKAPDTVPDWFKANAFHSGSVPPAFMVKGL